TLAGPAGVPPRVDDRGGPLQVDDVATVVPHALPRVLNQQLTRLLQAEWQQEDAVGAFVEEVVTAGVERLLDQQGDPLAGLVVRGFGVVEGAADAQRWAAGVRGQREGRLGGIRPAPLRGA